MDEDFIKAVRGPIEVRKDEERSASIVPIDYQAGTVELVDGDRREPYTLKPLKDLYGPGVGGTADPQAEAFMPLFLCIEEEIARYDALDGPIFDAPVAFALKTLSMDPDAQSSDPLVIQIQYALRLSLSMNNYSRQEVRQSIRKIGKSVERHSQGSHSRGYLDFIQKFMQKLMD